MKTIAANPLARYSIRSLLALVAAVAIWFAYETNWIRRRHDFLATQDELATRTNDSLFNYEDFTEIRLPRVQTFDATSESNGLLWLFNEPSHSSLDVLAVVDDSDIELPITSHAVVNEARRLFPEAQIIAAVLPKSYLKYYHGRPKGEGSSTKPR